MSVFAEPNFLIPAYGFAEEEENPMNESTLTWTGGFTYVSENGMMAVTLSEKDATRVGHWFDVKMLVGGHIVPVAVTDDEVTEPSVRLDGEIDFSEYADDCDCEDLSNNEVNYNRIEILGCTSASTPLIARKLLWVRAHGNVSNEVVNVFWPQWNGYVRTEVMMRTDMSKFLFLADCFNTVVPYFRGNLAQANHIYQVPTFVRANPHVSALICEGKFAVVISRWNSFVESFNEAYLRKRNRAANPQLEEMWAHYFDFTEHDQGKLSLGDRLRIWAQSGLQRAGALICDFATTGIPGRYVPAGASGLRDLHGNIIPRPTVGGYQPYPGVVRELLYNVGQLVSHFGASRIWDWGT